MNYPSYRRLARCVTDLFGSRTGLYSCASTDGVPKRQDLTNGWASQAHGRLLQEVVCGAPRIVQHGSLVRSCFDRGRRIWGSSPKAGRSFAHRIVRTALLCLGSMALSQCIDPFPPEAHVIPAGYHGVVSVRYDQRGVPPPELWNGRRIVRIGPDGVGRTSYKMDGSTLSYYIGDSVVNVIQAYYENGDGSLTPIPMRWYDDALPETTGVQAYWFSHSRVDFSYVVGPYEARGAFHPDDTGGS